MDHTVSVELSVVKPMVMFVDHPLAAEVAGALPAVTISGATVEHLG